MNLQGSISQSHQTMDTLPYEETDPPSLEEFKHRLDSYLGFNNLCDIFYVYGSAAFAEKMQNSFELGD